MTDFWWGGPIKDEDSGVCLSTDTRPDGRTFFILCHKAKGHAGDHGNPRYTWPVSSEDKE